MEGHLPLPEQLDPFRDDVPDDYGVSEVGEADPADEACVSGAEERDSSHGRRGYFAFKGFSPFAIAIMVSFERLSSRELTTQ